MGHLPSIQPQFSIRTISPAGPASCWIIIPFELKKVFIQEGAGPAGTFDEAIHYAQNVTNTVEEDSMERMKAKAGASPRILELTLRMRGRE